MNLADYARTIDEITESPNLTPAEKCVALTLLATEMQKALWQPWAKTAASNLATQALARASMFPAGDLAALDGLAAKGLLRKVAS